MTWTPFVRMQAIPLTEKQLADMAKAASVPLDVFKEFVEGKYVEDEIWANNTYQVIVKRNLHPPELVEVNWPPMTHLSCKRLDRDPIHDWRDLQRIKNELVGPEFEAVELYPAESRLVDTSNQYHLWVLQDDKVRLPFGFITRLTFGESVGGAKQRKRDAT